MNNSAAVKILNTFPTDSRIEHLSDDVGFPEREILSLLKAGMGGDDTPPWPANQRWLLWFSNELVGHVSAQRRWFVVNSHYLEGWHLGGVCVHPNVQRKGIGTLMMERAHADLSHQELGFAVLNCGHSLVRFYERVGYVKVSDYALYIRDEKLVIDDDPVLAISFQEGFNVASLVCTAFPFGFDF